MKKTILLSVSLLLAVIATSIPFCIIAAVAGSLDTAQKSIAGLLSVVGYMASIMYFQMYRAVRDVAVEYVIIDELSIHEDDKAQEYLKNGYRLASLHENPEDEDHPYVILNDDAGNGFHKTGWYVLKRYS